MKELLKFRDVIEQDGGIFIVDSVVDGKVNIVDLEGNQAILYEDYIVIAKDYID